MKAKILRSMVFAGALAIGSQSAFAAETQTATGGVKLSPELRNLLSSEMREISGGMQAMSLSIAIADWKSVHAISAKISASYIMEKNLTPAQARELEEALPERFKHLDARFHQRADKLGAAALAHDAELVTFQYSRLLESCTVCHAEYAKSRFPGFSSETGQEHHH